MRGDFLGQASLDWEDLKQGRELNLILRAREKAEERSIGGILNLLVGAVKAQAIGEQQEFAVDATTTTIPSENLSGGVAVISEVGANPELWWPLSDEALAGRRGTGRVVCVKYVFTMFTLVAGYHDNEVALQQRKSCSGTRSPSSTHDFSLRYSFFFRALSTRCNVPATCIGDDPVSRGLGEGRHDWHFRPVCGGAPERERDRSHTNDVQHSKPRMERAERDFPGRHGWWGGPVQRCGTAVGRRPRYGTS